MPVTTMNMGSGDEMEALRGVAEALGVFRVSGPGAGEVGSFPELVKQIGTIEPERLAAAIGDLMSDSTVGGGSHQTTVSNITEAQLQNLRESARLLGCLQTRGAGAALGMGNVSLFLRKLAAADREKMVDALRQIGISDDRKPVAVIDSVEYYTYEAAGDALSISKAAAWKRFKGANGE